MKPAIFLASLALVFATAGFVVNYTIQQSREEIQIVETSTPKPSLKIPYTPLNSPNLPTPQISSAFPDLSDSPDLVLGEQAEEVGQLSVNDATLEELDTVPGIGPKTAQKIIDGRPWGSLEQAVNLISKRWREEARGKLKL